jgi:MarR family 2-MHQ and catechol resistance regulon transcriptional repressor
MSDFMILEALLHHTQLTITGIQEKALLATGSMTVAVDRLENKGLINRRTTKDDRRTRLLELTRKGRTLIEKVLQVHLREIETWMAPLKENERAAAYDVLRKLGLHAAEIGKTTRAPKGRKP